MLFYVTAADCGRSSWPDVSRDVKASSLRGLASALSIWSCLTSLHSYVRKRVGVNCTYAVGGIGG